MSVPTHERVLLRDGGSLTIRQHEAADGPLLEELAGALSAESTRLRFHSGGLRNVAERLLPPGDARTFVAIASGGIAGIASFVRMTDPTMAEIAVAVRDSE